MNKIIWKDIDSTSIKGLLISELPAITKPKMRVQETEIDGVDGSIIEELGYESYDKSIKIGLYGKYDIDEVIKYFSGEGQVVFSNEPDKYYNAKIIDQIDYERLLRFREAVVRFRVQPFKYEYKEKETILSKKAESINIKWDGDVTGKEVIENVNGAYGMNLYKVSDLVPTEEDLIGGTYTTNTEDAEYPEDNDERVDTIENITYLTDDGNVYLIGEYFIPAIVVIKQSNAEYPQSEGLYLFSASEDSLKIYISSLDFEGKAKDTVINKGNHIAKPVMKITGTGNVEVLVNDIAVFTYTFPDNETEVVIDSQKQDAYLGTVLKNRNMIGEFPVLETGKNIITWNGTIDNIKVSQQSRWL